MKKILLFSAIFLFAFVKAFSQDCILLSDSIIAGEDETAYKTYIYNAEKQIVKIEETDSSFTAYNQYDTLIYDNNILKTVKRFDTNDENPYETITFTYNSSNQMSRIASSGNRGDGDWAMAHDISYNASGQILEMVLDNSAIVGDPEGFRASFKDIVWSNGNISTVSLVGEFGNKKAVETIELAITYDDKKNVERLFHINEASDLILRFNANNIMKMTFVNDETMGNAGTVAMQKNYTYTGDNEVETLENLAGVFENDSYTTKFRYQCSPAAINDISLDKSNIYPNPVQQKVNIDLGKTETNFTVEICNLKGQIIFKEDYKNKDKINVDLQKYSSGIYIIRIIKSEKTDVYKIIKN